MAIPEQQLEIWSHLGATDSAAALYARIDAALRGDPVLQNRNFEVFLQGSYRNSTNIRGDSDVDVVVMLNETYMPDYSRLDAYSRGIAERGAAPASYRLTDFRADVSAAIRRAFPSHSITEGGKSIKIPRTSNNIPADVVPCLEYRLYLPHHNLLIGPGRVNGIWLWDMKLQRVATSFPKQAYDNGVAKHARTGQWFKPTVRIFKNARGWMVDNGLIQQDTASSNAIECMLYNVPDTQFGQSYVNTFVNAVTWLRDADLSQFVCENGIQPLFAEDRWTIDKAHTFIGALIQMWNQWGQHARLRIG